MKYFNYDELGGKPENFHPGVCEKLDHLRELVGRPFIITSGARSQAHNAEVGGKDGSLHIFDVPQQKGQKGCMAFDIAVPDPTFKFELVTKALGEGWSVGINDKKRFIHIDRRKDIGLPQTIFSY